MEDYFPVSAWYTGGRTRATLVEPPGPGLPESGGRTSSKSGPAGLTLFVVGWSGRALSRDGTSCTARRWTCCWSWPMT